VHRHYLLDLSHGAHLNIFTHRKALYVCERREWIWWVLFSEFRISCSLNINCAFRQIYWKLQCNSAQSSNLTECYLLGTSIIEFLLLATFLLQRLSCPRGNQLEVSKVGFQVRGRFFNFWFLIFLWCGTEKQSQKGKQILPKEDQRKTEGTQEITPIQGLTFQVTRQIATRNDKTFDSPYRVKVVENIFVGKWAFPKSWRVCCHSNPP